MRRIKGGRLEPITVEVHPDLPVTLGECQVYESTLPPWR
jgi:hypothetical protein